MAETIEYNSNDLIAQEIQSIHNLCNFIENYKQSSNCTSNSSKLNVQAKKKTHHKTKSADCDYSTHKPSISSQNDKSEQIYIRFKKYQINKSDHLFQLKKKLKNEEQEKTKKLGMNKISRDLARNDLDFITRMENYKEKAERKRYEEQEKLKKKKEEEESKEMEEFHKRNDKKYDKNYLENKIQSIIQNESKKKTIDKLAQQFTEEFKEVCTFQPNTEKNMDKIRVEYKKPYQKSTREQFNETDCTKISHSKNKEYKLPQVPKIITHASNKAAIIDTKSNYEKTPDFVNRLYKEDIQKRKHKKEILEDVFAPHFNPIIEKDKNNYIAAKLHSENNKEYIRQPEIPIFDYDTYLLENGSMEDMLRERVKLGRMKNLK
jgi:hypothetical protein